MKTLSTLLENKYITEYFNEINAEVVCEALKDPKLQLLAKQLRAFGSKNKKDWNNRSFSGIFGQYGVNWDQIEPSDWEEYNCEDEKEKKNAQKAVRKCISNRLNSIRGISLISVDGENIRYMIEPFGNIIDFKAKQYISIYDRKPGEENIDYKESPKNISVKKEYETMAYLDNAKKVWVLPLSGHEIFDKKAARRNAQDGIVLQGDEEYYKRLAQSNVERYKKMIAKAKAEAASKTDTIAQDVQEIVNDVMDLTKAAAADPIKYADVSYDICSLVEKVYSQRQYDTKRNQGYGSDGLLILFKIYLENHLTIAKNGGHDYNRTSKDNAVKNIKTKIDQIKQQIVKIKEKIF